MKEMLNDNQKSLTLVEFVLKLDEMDKILGGIDDDIIIIDDSLEMAAQKKKGLVFCNGCERK